MYSCKTNIKQLGSQKVIIAPQTKFFGLYRNHPVHLSVYISCKLNSSLWNEWSIMDET